MKGSYYNWVFYDVETHDKKTDNFIKYENFMKLEQAEEYIKNTMDLKCLDCNEKLVLVRREYNPNEDLIDEEIIKEVDYEN